MVGQTILIITLLLHIVTAATLNDCIVGQTKPNINNCQKYFTCETLTIGSSFGKWESKSCGLNKLYDTKSQICLETGQATCAECIDGEKFPLSGECIYYNLCVNGLFKAYKCPSKRVEQNGAIIWKNTMFNRNSSQCVEKSKIVIPGKCQSYQECKIVSSMSHVEKWIETKCQNSFHFDPKSKTCIPSNSSTCESDACSDNPCKNGGFCETKNDDDYSCSCPTGFTGPNCQYKNNPCSIDSCLNGGTCFAYASGSSKCVCREGFSGNECQIDERISIQLTGHTDSVFCVAFGKGNIIASGSADRTVKLWNWASRQLIRTLSGHTDSIWSVAFGQDNILASGSDDKSVKLWNSTNGELIRTLTGHTEWVRSVTVGENNVLASGSADKTVKLWSLTNGQLINTLTEHTGPVRCTAFGKGSILASASDDKTVMLWNTDNGELVRTLTGFFNFVASLAFGEDNILATGSVEGDIMLWNSDNGQLVRAIDGHKNIVLGLAFGTGNILASGSWDKTVKLWNPVNGQFIRNFTGHSDKVWGVAFGQGNILASGSDDNSVMLWINSN